MVRISKVKLWNIKQERRREISLYQTEWNNIYYNTLTEIPEKYNTCAPFYGISGCRSVWISMNNQKAYADLQAY